MPHSVKPYFVACVLAAFRNFAPFASASEILAKRLGVDMSKGYTTDPANSDKELDDPGVIVYSRENHLLAEHAITNGRNDA